MKLATFFAATLAAGTTLVSAAHAAGVVFDTPVTYTERVTYAAGVTYLAPVTYSAGAEVAARARAAASPTLLERVIVTPTRSYAESEWKVHLASRKAAAQLYPVRSERRVETRAPSAFRILLPLQ